MHLRDPDRFAITKTRAAALIEFIPPVGGTGLRSLNAARRTKK